MAIIEDYGAIAKRVRELTPVPANQGHKEIDDLDKWRHLAEGNGAGLCSEEAQGHSERPYFARAIPARTTRLARIPGQAGER